MFIVGIQDLGGRYGTCDFNHNIRYEYWVGPESCSDAARVAYRLGDAENFRGLNGVLVGSTCGPTLVALSHPVVDKREATRRWKRMVTVHERQTHDARREEIGRALDVAGALNDFLAALFSNLVEIGDLSPKQLDAAEASLMCIDSGGEVGGCLGDHREDNEFAASLFDAMSRYGWDGLTSARRRAAIEFHRQMKEGGWRPSFLSMEERDEVTGTLFSVLGENQSKLTMPERDFLRGCAWRWRTTATPLLPSQEVRVRSLCRRVQGEHQR